MTIEYKQMTADFLLGRLPEEKRDAIEQRFFGDGELFDELLIAENELTDSYVAGRLSGADRQLFEQRLLLNPRQRQRVTFAKLLFAYVSRPASGTHSGSVTAAKGFFASLYSALAGRQMAFVLGGALIVVLGIGSLLLRSDRTGFVTDPEIAEVQIPVPETPIQAAGDPINTPESGPINERTAANAEHPAAKPRKPAVPKPNAAPSGPPVLVSSIFLTLGSTRAAGSSTVYNIPVNSTHVRLHLALEDTSYTSYMAVVETVEGQQIASRRASKSGEYVTFQLPAKHLQKGDYIVSLKGARKGSGFEPVGDYTFTIDKKEK